MDRILEFIFVLAIVFIYNSSALTQTMNNREGNGSDTLINYYSQEILNNPNISENYYKRAQCYFNISKYDSAIADLNKAIGIKEIVLYYYDRAIIYMQKYLENMDDVSSALNALKDFDKVKILDLRFYEDYFIEEIDELKSIFSEEDINEYKYLGGGLYQFNLNKSGLFYIRFPELLPSSIFNIIKQDPKKEGPGSSKFLLKTATKQKFLNSLVSCISIIQREEKLFIMTIDDHTRKGVQHDLTYGTDTNDLKSPSLYPTWIDDLNSEIDITGWLKFDEDLRDNVIQHDGKLTIKVLKDSQPVRLIGSSISCAKIKQIEEFDNAVYEKIVEISDCLETKINLKLALPDDTRWLLDKFKDPLLRTDLNLVINGKTIPNKMEYVKETSDGISVNFTIRLKKVTK